MKLPTFVIKALSIRPLIPWKFKTVLLVEELKASLQILGMSKQEVDDLVHLLLKEAKTTPELTSEYIIRKLEEKRDGLAKGNPK